MQIHDMIDAVIDTIQSLDPDREFRALSAHVAVTSPAALELLTYEHLSSPAYEARRIAGVQLRVICELADRLRWLESACLDPGLAPELRVALAGVLRSLIAESDLLPAGDSEAAVLLEPALLFHRLLSQLRPWVSPMNLELEPESVLELLQLGIPDYLHPLLYQRFESTWELFHQLRQLPPARLALLSDPPRIDDARLLRLLEDPQLGAHSSPAAPAWNTPGWVSPWMAELEHDSDAPRPLPRIESGELTG